MGIVSIDHVDHWLCEVVLLHSDMLVGTQTSFLDQWIMALWLYWHGHGARSIFLSMKRTIHGIALRLPTGVYGVGSSLLRPVSVSRLHWTEVMDRWNSIFPGRRSPNLVTCSSIYNAWKRCLTFITFARWL